MVVNSEINLRFSVRRDPGTVAPQFSSDGRWLAYASDESGRHETYVQPHSRPMRQVADLDRWLQ
jgi:Tol biopolymer transport system component